MVIGTAIIIVVGAVMLLSILIAYIVGMYNSIITLKNNIDKSWFNIDVLLKQRTDELPKLIACVKGYMKHEKGLLESIAKARSELLKSNTMSTKAKADIAISSTLKTLFAVAENYPTLKANENFMQLQQRITGLENEIADRREFYNDSVNNYNTRIESFPDMFIARLVHLARREMFKVSESDKQVVKAEI